MIADQLIANKVINEKRRLEATAIVMLGVIGSEFGKEIEPAKTHPKLKKRVSMEGFRIGSDSLAWHTSKRVYLLMIKCL